MESGFDKNSSSFSINNQDTEGRIDFNLATKLKDSGSTCDTYVTRVANRHIFVKRLKEQFRDKPLYRSAFQKEYEIGAGLRHKSLPVYLEFNDDYICLDYIDGHTLADMIKDCDPWLIKKENILQLLSDIIDVLAYLHDKNIIHCDIKPDNLMLTYGSHNLFLIDLDKCYTSWFDSTAGSSEKFGLRENTKKDPAMDFRGLGRILEFMEDSLPGFPSQDFRLFKEECFSEGATLDILQNLLKATNKPDNRNSNNSKSRKYKSRQQEPTVLDQKERERLERERRAVEDRLIIFDGPLKYCISKSTNEVSVACRDDARKVCFEANIINPYQINGKDYYVTTVPMNAFSDCVNLQSIILPQGITTLYRTTFTDCSSLEYVKIPASVKTILGGVFVGCKNLQKVEFENPNGVTISPDFLSGSNDSVEIVDLSTGTSYTYEDFIKKFCL